MCIGQKQDRNEEIIKLCLTPLFRPIIRLNLQKVTSNGLQNIKGHSER